MFKRIRLEKRCQYCYEKSSVRCFLCGKRICSDCKILIENKPYCYNDFINKMEEYYKKDLNNKKYKFLLQYIFEILYYEVYKHGKKTIINY